MKSLFASLLLIPLVSCGDSSSSGKSGGKNSGGSGGSSDGESGEESVYEPDFEAISARCYETNEKKREAQYECCVEEGEWDPYAGDEEWCYDFHVEKTWSSDGPEPHLACAVSVIQEGYDSIVDDGYSPECIEERLSWYALHDECLIEAHAGGCASEAASDLTTELTFDCINNMAWWESGSDCE
jgi:hypothetical protein